MSAKKQKPRRKKFTSRNNFGIVSVVKKNYQLYLCAATLLFLACGGARAQIFTDDRALLEQQLDEVERQIYLYENTIEDYRKQGRSLRGEVKKLDAEVSKFNLQIKAINLSLARLDQDIAKNKGDIIITDEKLRFHQNALSATLQSLFEEDEVSLIEILLTHPELSDFFNNVDGLFALQDGLRDILQTTTEAKNQLVDLKEQLALKKTDTSYLKLAREAEKKAVEGKKNEKNNLLASTKGREEEYQKLLKESRKTAAQIRNRIFEFLGGGELTFEQAYQLAKSASALVGVRPALVLAVLDRESALGQNVGRCSYKTAMHPTRDIPIFLALASELGLNPDGMSVSCANRDGAFGGAMGISQFIPSTWNKYRKRVEELTGNHPPSPWRHIDAFVATALYLKDAGAGGERNITKDRQAAARYYAGSRWRSYLWTYGERVVSKARQFEEDIAALNT